MASSRASTSFCFSLCGGGVYSSLDTHWVGIGVACGSNSDGISSAISFSVKKPMVSSVYALDVAFGRVGSGRSSLVF